MKKFLSILILTVLTTGISFGAEVAPKWEEFAPQDASANDIYWVQRKAKFDQALKQCSFYQGKDLKACYNQIRETEKIKTQAKLNRY